MKSLASTMRAPFFSAMLAWLLSACAAIDFESQDLDALLDTDADTLVLELTYNSIEAVAKQKTAWTEEGITSSPGELDLEGGAALLRRMASGERVFMIGLPILKFSFDKGQIEKELMELEPEAPPLMVLSLKYVNGITMEDARLYLDDSGHLKVWQRIIFPNFSQGLKLTNEAMRQSFLEEYAEGEFNKPGAFLDLATVEMFHADALAGFDWVRWTTEGLEFSFPASPEFLAGLVLDGINGIGETPDKQAGKTIANFRAYALLFAPLSKLTVQDNRVSILFGSELDGHLRVHVPLKKLEAKGVEKVDEYSPALRDYLQENGMMYPSVWSKGKN